jgi:Flp pilus assembly protein TadD
MSYVSAGIGLVVVMVAPGCGRSSQDLVARGNGLLARGQFQEAVLDFRKALQRERPAAS